MVESWVAFSIFQVLAFILFLYVVVRSVYRCYTYHDCCRRCKKEEAAPAGQPGKPVPPAPVPQSSGDAETPVRPNMDKIEVELFDPSRPLELPIHGIHYPDPLENWSEAGSSVGEPVGGHNLDFTVENIGYDEPDREGHQTIASAVVHPSATDDSPSEADPQPSGHTTSPDADSQLVPGPDADSQLVPGPDASLPDDNGEPLHDAGARPDSTADTYPAPHTDVTTAADTSADVEGDTLVTEGNNSDGAFGKDNPAFVVYL